MKHLFFILFTAFWFGGLQAQTLPIKVNEQNPLTKFSVEASSDTCDAVVALTVFDPDFRDESSFFWNSYEHFLYSDTAGRSVSQLSQPDLPFEVLDGQTIIYFIRVPRSEVLAGENIVQFQHNGSAGSTISGFNVSYDCIPNSLPVVGDSTGRDSLAVCYLTKAQIDSIQAWLDVAVCIDSSEVAFGDTLVISVEVDDTTFVPVTVMDTTFNIVEINDTIRNSITIRDTLFLREFDTTFVNEVIVNFDTTFRDTLIFSDTIQERTVITNTVIDTVPASLCPPAITGRRDTLIVPAIIDTVFNTSSNIMLPDTVIRTFALVNKIEDRDQYQVGTPSFGLYPSNRFSGTRANDLWIANGISDIAVYYSRIEYTQYLNGTYTPEQIKAEAEANWRQ